MFSCTLQVPVVSTQGPPTNVCSTYYLDRVKDPFVTERVSHGEPAAPRESRLSGPPRPDFRPDVQEPACGTARRLPRRKPHPPGTSGGATARTDPFDPDRQPTSGMRVNTVEPTPGCRGHSSSPGFAPGPLCPLPALWTRARGARPAPEGPSRPLAPTHTYSRRNNGWSPGPILLPCTVYTANVRYCLAPNIGFWGWRNELFFFFIY